MRYQNMILKKKNIKGDQHFFAHRVFITFLCVQELYIHPEALNVVQNAPATFYNIAMPSSETINTYMLCWTILVYALRSTVCTSGAIIMCIIANCGNLR